MILSSKRILEENWQKSLQTHWESSYSQSNTFSDRRGLSSKTNPHRQQISAPEINLQSGSIAYSKLESWTSLYHRPWSRRVKGFRMRSFASLHSRTLVTVE